MFHNDITQLPTRFREGALHGPYLWDWANECGLKGAGFAPTSMGGHHFITRAALRVLPEVVDWLRGEAQLLMWCYCGFPDMNWPQYGTFGTESINTRMPDSRREWDISHYCRYNSLLNQGHFIGHHPDKAIEGVADRYRDAVEAANAGHGRDAIRFLGAAIHYLEDCGSPPHAANLSGPNHMPAESVRDVAGIRIDGYTPKPLMDFQGTVDELAALGLKNCQSIVKLIEAGRSGEILPFQVECANRCAQAVADLLLRFHSEVGGKVSFLPSPAPGGVELLHNGTLAAAGDAPFCPDGWVMYWEDRADRDVAIERAETGDGIVVEARNTKAKTACRTTWPKAIRCVAGQRFRLTGDIRCGAGEAGLEAMFTDDATCPLAVPEACVQPDNRWHRVALELTAPDGAEILRPGAFARNLPGTAQFRNLSLHAL
ncbi:MAG: hypothetical protein RBU25_16145 [Lentisphaeria bacterium]|jgi:hypothetical protein|nr:hypothetical protein [Lentisphaeria bacterium]